MKVFFGTVVRSAPVREGGELVRLDWETKRVESKVPIFPSNPSLDHDPNPRGNTRGCRGLYLWDKWLIVSTYHTVKIFDYNLEHKKDLSHGLMVGLHEISGVRNKVWLTSTAIDGAIEYDLNSEILTNAFFPREMPEFQNIFNLIPIKFNKGLDQRCNYLGSEHTKHNSHLHLNAVAQWNGNVYALFNSFGTIVNLSQGKVIIEDPKLKKGHNLFIMENGTAISNDTRSQTVRFYDLSTQKIIKSINLLKFPWVKKLAKNLTIKYYSKKVAAKLGLSNSSLIAQPLFVRGLDLNLDNNLLFIGISPASILCIDWEKEELVDAYNYSNKVYECIHGLKVM